MSAPLLEVSNLTVRFGGLTAVSDVKLAVGQGEIVAVIGPNGAGKTTLFNAIAGIYEPTSGSIRFEGTELARPRTARHWLTWGLLGLVTGVFLLLFVANVDELWAVTIKRNYHGREQGFALNDALESASGYLRARPRLDARLGRFYVTSHDGTIQLASAGSRADAEAKRAAYLELGSAGGVLETLNGKTRLLSRDHARVLLEADTPAEAEQQLQTARSVFEAATRARRLRVLALLFGIALGVGGGHTIWRQTQRAPSYIASRGIARTFQNIRLFQDMTVLDNVLVGMDRHFHEHTAWYSRERIAYVAAPALLVLGLAWLGLAQRLAWLGSGALAVCWLLCLLGGLAYVVHLQRLGAFSPHARRASERGVVRARELLDFVGLAESTGVQAKHLAYGDQRRLEIARALATQPKLLLLDEPAAGMNPAESASLTGLIRAIRERGVTVLLIEHHMRVVMGISDRVCVLEYGRKIAEGTPQAIQADPRVIEAYLGKEELG